MFERMTLRLMPRSMSQSVHVKRSGQYMKLWSRISIAVPMKMTCTIFMCVVSLGRELPHLSQCDGAHANKDWGQQQSEEGEVVVVRIPVPVLLVVAQCH